MNNRPPRNPSSLARQYPSLEGIKGVPHQLTTAVRHAYQHIYDLRDDMLQRLANMPEGDGGCSCAILKGTVPTFDDLPTDPEPGDGWIVEDTGHMWVWDGTAWVDAGDMHGPPGADGAPGPPGADGAPGPPGTGSLAYLSSLFAGPDTTRTITGATHLYTTPGLLVAVYDNASPRNAIEAGWTVDATTYDVVITFAAPQSNYYVVINGATGMQGPAGSGGGGTGTVTSVALTVPAEFSVSGSPVTTSGTLAVSKATQSANTVYAGPTTGSAAAPTFRAIVPADLPSASSGALILLEQHTASSSASLIFTACITSSYDDYAIELLNVVPATNAVQLYLRMSKDGGSTYDGDSGGTAYANSDFRWIHNATAVCGSFGNSQIILDADTAGEIGNTTSYGGLSGSIRLFNPLSSSVYKSLIGQIIYLNNSGAALITGSIASMYKDAGAVNAFKIFFSSGNIASGTVRVYGIAK